MSFAHCQTSSPDAIDGLLLPAVHVVGEIAQARPVPSAEIAAAITAALAQT